MKSNAAVNTQNVLNTLHEAITALKLLEFDHAVIAEKLGPGESHPLGPRKLIVSVRQNLEAARGNVKSGILRDHRGYEIGNYNDLAEIVSREEDLSGIIDR